VTVSSSVSAKPRSASVFLSSEEPLLLFVPLDDRVNFDGFVVSKGRLLLYPLGRDPKAGMNLTTRGFRAGTQAHTIARFISIAAQ
jgi:hypothetical protein